MSGAGRTISGPHRFENLDCPVEAGESCVAPERRGLNFDGTINIPSLVAVIMMVASFIGYVVTNDRRVTKVEGEKEVLELADKGLRDHLTAVEQLIARDRIELKADMKEIKDQLNRMAERGR